LAQDSAKVEMDWLFQLEMGQRNGMEFIKRGFYQVLGKRNGMEFINISPSWPHKCIVHVHTKPNFIHL
jgi:hypothetical protein